MSEIVVSTADREVQLAQQYIFDHIDDIIVEGNGICIESALFFF